MIKLQKGQKIKEISQRSLLRKDEDKDDNKKSSIFERLNKLASSSPDLLIRSEIEDIIINLKNIN